MTPARCRMMALALTLLASPALALLASPALAEPLQDCAENQARPSMLQHKTITIRPQPGIPTGEARAAFLACLRERLASADAAMTGTLAQAQQWAALSTATGALDQSQGSFISYRQQACDVAALLPPADVQPEEAQLACAIRLAEQRTAELKRLRYHFLSPPRRTRSACNTRGAGFVTTRRCAGRRVRAR
jgi:uncharacterized protein YecT (DUF1311 family)